MYSSFLCIICLHISHQQFPSDGFPRIVHIYIDNCYISRRIRYIPSRAQILPTHLSATFCASFTQRRVHHLSRNHILRPCSDTLTSANDESLSFLALLQLLLHVLSAIPLYVLLIYFNPSPPRISSVILAQEHLMLIRASPVCKSNS